jgi:outer membrane cobalamin receptor
MCCPFLLAPQTRDPPPNDPPKPEPVITSITVVEKISAETPANVTVLDNTAIQQSPGTNLDDRLRDVPGFSLFRRSSSLAANPTTQGISLRGIGSSGASRTLVLWDGIPANDPFGGWVYWTQFVPGEIARAEISRGAATAIFGDRAMSGAIGIFSRQPEKLHVLGEYEFGNENTHDLSAGFADAWSRLAISGTARAFTTDGYFIVPASIRGAADTRAGVRFVTGDVRIDHYTSFSKPACWPKSGRTAPRSPTIPPASAPCPCVTPASSPAIPSPCSVFTPARASTARLTASRPDAIPIA